MKTLLTLLLSIGLFAFVVAQTGGISGVVTDSVTGNPIANAMVSAMSHHGGRSAITNENGEYLIENLQPGGYRVSAMAEGYIHKMYPELVTVEAGQITENINFALAPYSQPEPGGISGVVTDSVTGNPISGAMVVAMGHHRRGGGRATTNENGEYLIENLRPGEYRVTANARGYIPKHYPEPVTVEAGQITPNINFALAPMAPPPEPGSISGMVTDANTGKPIAGAVVMAKLASRRHHRHFARAITGPDGTYTIENLIPGEYRVAAHARGYEHQVYPELVVVEPGQNTPNINFALVPRQTGGQDQDRPQDRPRRERIAR